MAAILSRRRWVKLYNGNGICHTSYVTAAHDLPISIFSQKISHNLFPWLFTLVLFRFPVLKTGLGAIRAELEHPNGGNKAEYAY